MAQIPADAWTQLDGRMNAMIKRVQSLSPELQKQPVGKSFSPLEALEHMAITEQLYVDLAKKTDMGKMQGRNGKPNFFYRMVMKQMLAPKGKTASTIKELTPAPGVTLEGAAQKWRTNRAALKAHFASVGNDDAAAFKHSFFGYLSANDVFTLLGRHQDYHDARLP
jgi:hypothetical protein